MEPHIVSNLIVCGVVVCAATIARAIRRHDLWRQAAVELWRRRPLALGVLAVYVAVAFADSLAWKGGVDVGEDVVAAHQPVSILDRIFAGRKEKSYSAPFAAREFYDKSPLRYPGGHWLGTDILGNDVLLASLKGARVALLIGGLTSALAIPLALLFGVSAGYFGKRIDDVVFFVISTLASIPSLLLLIAFIMAWGKGTLQVCVALALTSWVGFCRVVRGEAMKLREMDYVNAARTLGVSEVRIIVRHIVPNLVHLVVITFVLMFSGLVLSEAVLAWLGIGVDGSWGQMIAQAKDELSRTPVIWWNISAAGVAMFGLLLAMNVIGDAVRDILDPHTLKERL